MNNETVHIWYHCHHCGASPITGNRHQCQSCPDGPDNDLCQPCFQLFQKGGIQHPSPESASAGLNIPQHHFKEYEGKPAHLFKHWLDVVHPYVKDPIFPSRFVIRPIFESGMDSTIGGYGFVADLEGSVEQKGMPLVFTALHVMDELIKKKGIDCSARNTAYTGKELPGVIDSVGLYDVFAPMWMTAHLGTASPMLELAGAGTGDEEPYSNRDIAAFKLEPGASLNPVPLAQLPPRVGESVWLVARAQNQPHQNLFKAVVVESTDRSLVFRFQGTGEIPKYSSGAPLLDKEGRVAGINVGGGKLHGQRLGHANHVGNIRKHLSELS